MVKRIAIPLVNEQLSEYFGECSCYRIIEIDGANASQYEINLPPGIAVHELPGWLEKIGITDVIAYKINPEIILLFATKKVTLFVGVPVDSPAKLVENYLQGKLESDERIIREITMAIK